MKIIKVQVLDDIPDYFTGIAEYQNGTKYWIKNDKLHREDGPACEWADGTKHWCLEGVYYPKINIKDYVVLDSYKGKYDLTWYKLLGEDQIFEYPDIPGLIEK